MGRRARRNGQAVHGVVLVDKPARRAVDITADDQVLHLDEDLFLVGCGLDWAGKYRNLPELCYIEQVATS